MAFTCSDLAEAVAASLAGGRLTHMPTRQHNIDEKERGGVDITEVPAMTLELWDRMNSFEPSKP